MNIQIHVDSWIDVNEDKENIFIETVDESQQTIQLILKKCWLHKRWFKQFVEDLNKLKLEKDK